jgi:hypothetical protein
MVDGRAFYLGCSDLLCCVCFAVSCLLLSVLQSVLLSLPTGLLPYSPPSLPADLNVGFETEYTKKDDSEPSPVDTIIQAGTAAAVDWSKVGLCTYRNNLNKVLLTPVALENEWAVDACFWGGTLFLDINKAGFQEYANQDRFVYYGRPDTLQCCVTKFAAA